MADLRRRLARLEQQVASMGSAMTGSSPSDLLLPTAAEVEEVMWTPTTGWSCRLVEEIALKWGISEERVTTTLNDAMQRLRDAGLADF